MGVSMQLLHPKWSCSEPKNPENWTNLSNVLFKNPASYQRARPQGLLRAITETTANKGDIWNKHRR